MMFWAAKSGQSPRHPDYQNILSLLNQVINMLNAYTIFPQRFGIRGAVLNEMLLGKFNPSI
jgi:hypothetical protein